MALDPIALELYVYLPHRDLTIRNTVPGRADPSDVGRLAEQYVGNRPIGYVGDTSPGLVARCAGILIYAMDGYGLTFEEVCGLADHEVATMVAGITPDNRLTEPTRQLKLRDAVGQASEVGQIVRLAEIAAFATKTLHDLLAEDYLQYAQQLKLIVDRHGQVIQAMSRLHNRGIMTAAVDSVKASLDRISHEVDHAKAARTAARQSAQGCEAT